jgi:hypothetical protein
MKRLASCWAATSMWQSQRKVPMLDMSCWNLRAHLAGRGCVRSVPVARARRAWRPLH